MDIIKTYAPNNTNISHDELSAMKDLTDAQIDQLAKAYPNQPSGNAYLVYYMKNEKENEQRYPLGTWANLNSLRKLGRNDVLPFGFRKTLVRQAISTQPAAQRVVDLSQDEVKNAEGLKAETAPPAQAVPEVAPVSPELAAAEKELQQAIDDKAHPNTIKAKQKKLDEMKAAETQAEAQGATQTSAAQPVPPATPAQPATQQINLNAL